MSYLGILGLEFEKKLSNLKSATSNLSNRKISRKPPPPKKMYKFATKNALFG